MRRAEPPNAVLGGSKEGCPKTRPEFYTCDSVKSPSIQSPSNFIDCSTSHCQSTNCLTIAATLLLTIDLAIVADTIVTQLPPKTQA